MSSRIPIQNIYFLLCYSWNRLAESEIVDVSGIDSTEQVDLFAQVLIRGTQHLIRRGLQQDYQTCAETIPAIRGRIDMATTGRRMLPAQGLAHCEFDELTTNTLANQIIKSSLFYLSKVNNIDSDLRRQLVSLHRELANIDSPPLSRGLFRRVQLHSNARFYKFLLSICEIIADSLLVDEKTGKYRFRDFLRDEKRMARVYEEFLFNFYRSNRPDLSIRKEKINWLAEAKDPANLAYLPTMETDISLRSASKTLIIDAKYYQETLTSYHNVERIHSANLYQLFAYLKNLEQRDGADKTAEGMLLYPVVNQKVRLDYTLHGHRLQICTVNLAAQWREIRDELLELVGCV